MFLPDRFIKGECPKCGAKDQYGDNCESCGAAYAPTDLKNPTRPCPAPSRNCATPTTISSSSPTRAARNSCAADHARVGRLPARGLNKLQEWLGEPGENKLTDWDISRDAPYFGFEIPGRAGQVFLRLAGCADRLHGLVQEPVRKQGLDFDEFWGKGFDGRAVPLHRQGHPLLPRAVLAGRAGARRLPHADAVFAHGFLTVDGAKMSKSRGTFITAESYLAQGLNPEWLRYYFAAKLNGTMEDIDLNLDDFVSPRQFRPRRQVHQHRQPRRRLHLKRLPAT
jgi:methionyl-tRNA synthetase